jgi:hypothetical protein
MTRVSMRSSLNRPSRTSNPLTSWTTAAVVGVTVLLLLDMNSISKQHQSRQPQDISAKQEQSAIMKEIEKGRTETGIEYYHCQDTSSSPKHLVLLHGAKFTKEDWKTSGILQQFCATPGLTVSALDLSVQATHQDFVQLLDQSSLFTPPVAAVVTPSASGKVITDWMMNGDVVTLPKYMQTWIPVAAGSVHSTTQAQLQALKDSGVDILAIYGDQDKVTGHDTSMLLQQWSGAMTVELKGGHPCYLDSPDEFVKVIQRQLAFS